MTGVLFIFSFVIMTESRADKTDNKYVPYFHWLNCLWDTESELSTSNRESYLKHTLKYKLFSNMRMFKQFVLLQEGKDFRAGNELSVTNILCKSWLVSRMFKTLRMLGILTNVLVLSKIWMFISSPGVREINKSFSY